MFESSRRELLGLGLRLRHNTNPVPQCKSQRVVDSYRTVKELEKTLSLQLSETLHWMFKLDFGQTLQQIL
jgi:hypothetical protein